MREIMGNQHLIDYLIAREVLQSPRLIEAFQRCDRSFFVPKELQIETYADYPLSIGEGQTISQPSTVAIMLELLNPKEGNKILDIGSGSGWTTALLATAVGEKGFVEGIERIPHLVQYSRENLQKIPIKNASITLSDASVLGKPGHLYDRILVSASAPYMPKSLFAQLKKGGIMVIPIENSVWRFMKNEDETIEAYELPGFSFVPLITPL